MNVHNRLWHLLALGALAVLTRFVPPLAAQEPDTAQKGYSVTTIDVPYPLSSFSTFVSPDGKLIVLTERQEGKIRHPVFETLTGELIRYLSAEEPKGVATAPVDFPGTLQTCVFSPDGNLIAGLTQHDGMATKIYVWDLATGKIKWSRKEGTVHHHTFRFANNNVLLAKTALPDPWRMDAIDIAKGEVKTILQPYGAEFYAGAVWKDELALVDPGEIFTVNITTGKRQKFASTAGQGGFAPDRMWYSAKGDKLMVKRESMIEIWDVTNKEFEKKVALVAQQDANRIAGIAPAENLVTIHRDEGVEVWDFTTGEIKAELQFPFRRPAVCGMSVSGNVIVVAGERQGGLALHFGNQPPQGKVDVSKLRKR